MIKITTIKSLYPSDPAGAPGARAALLFHAATEYRQVCDMLHSSEQPLFDVLVPALEQTIELLAKSIALRYIPGFEPELYKHKIIKIITDYADRVPIFAKLAATPQACHLFTDLSAGYLAVRYGEGHVSYDLPTWEVFCAVADELLSAAAP